MSSASTPSLLQPLGLPYNGASHLSSGQTMPHSAVRHDFNIFLSGKLTYFFCIGIFVRRYSPPDLNDWAHGSNSPFFYQLFKPGP